VKNSIHLLDTDEPVVCWTDLRVRCDLVLMRPEPVWMFRDDFKPTDVWLEGFSILQVCQKCLRNPPNTADSQREYLYGLVESQIHARLPKHTFAAGYCE